jgi:hypothetical protein
MVNASKHERWKVLNAALFVRQAEERPHVEALSVAAIGSGLAGEKLHRQTAFVQVFEQFLLADAHGSLTASDFSAALEKLRDGPLVGAFHVPSQTLAID